MQSQTLSHPLSNTCLLTENGHDEIAIPGGMPYPGDDSPASNSFSIPYKLLHTGQTTTTTHQGD